MKKKLVERLSAKQQASGDAVAVSEIVLPEGVPQLIVWDTELTGFGVVVGRTQRTFIFNFTAPDGAKRRQKIGIHGDQRGDGTSWNASNARQAAEELRGKVSGGIDPSAEIRARNSGPTLREAVALHVDKMRAGEASPRSIQAVESEIALYLGAWLDRPLRAITRTDCQTRHREISDKHGPYAANRTMRHVRAIWNTALKLHDIGPNPTIAVHWNKEHRRQEPIPWKDLPAWRAVVDTLEPLRRDYQLLVMLTGLREMDAATIRWDHIDLEARTLRRPNPKGGKDRAFTIPLSSPLVEILKRRRAENAELGRDDHGWVFPTTALKTASCHLCAALGLGGHVKGSVIHLAEGKQQTARGSKKAHNVIPTPHRSRDTYTTALAEVGGVSPFAIDMLTNHRPPRGSVTAGYINLSDGHLAECQERVSAFLLAGMGVSVDERQPLRAVA